MEGPHYHGHRRRLRERFLKSGLAGFAEHEIIELLLTLAIPRSDVKQPAKALLERFGSLRGVLDAPPAELRSVDGVGEVAGGDLQLPEGRAVVSIAPAIEQHCPELGESRRAVVGHLDGPLLMSAGPGSGKTRSMVLRALNLLLLAKTEPREIVLCTFTEKAAFERRDRLAEAGQVSVTMPPEPAICRECDPWAPCRAEGVIGESEALAA